MTRATIKQRFEKDCFLCCLAMARGVGYDLLLEELERKAPGLLDRVKVSGLYDKDVELAFGAAGFSAPDYFRLFILPEYATHGFIRNMLSGRRACIQVRSKNYGGEMHIVFWDGASLHDPSNKLTWKWEEVEPIYLWLFNEARDAAA